MFGIRVFHFVCNSARFLCAIEPVFGIIDKGHRRWSLPSGSDRVMLARGLPGFQYINNITGCPKALGNSATIAGVVRSVYARRWNFDYASRVSAA